jgi:DNA-binding CsgD family transcriptional regulator/energy-coupling factor transporter ATP-binding protein EcfA2
MIDLVELLERDAELATISQQWRRARSSFGSFVLVAGESGIGKSELVRAFADVVEPGTSVAWGACDPLHTPRPLGPLHDVAAEFGGRARELLVQGGAWHEISAAVFDELAGRPWVLVVDDLHWADQGTLDVLRFLLRRIGSTRSLVVGTYRDDEIGSDHPLRALLGGVARSPDAVSLTLRPLSLEVITALVGARTIDPVRLRELTRGNPFFVHEVLAAGGGGLPATVRDAVLARTVGLDEEARDLLDLLACSPEAVPDRALSALGIGLQTLRTLDGTGLVEHGRRGIAFRHELSRIAVENAIPPGGAITVHARMLAALESAGGDAVSLVHHALAAGDDARVLRYASLAGDAAARAGAHTQAAEFFEVALDHASQTSPRDGAELLERRAAELYLTDRLPEAILSCERALSLRRGDDDLGGMSADYHALSVYEWYNANRAVAERHALAAVEVLPPGVEPANRGHGYALEAYLAFHNSDLDRARAFHDRARDVAAQARNRQLDARLEIIDAVVAIMRGDVRGRERILGLIERDAEYFDDLYSSGYSNVAYLDVEQRRLQAADDVLAVSLPLTRERDIPICNVWQLGVRARLALLRGHWDAAVADAEEVLGGRGAPLARTWPHLVRGLVALRRGAQQAESDLDAAWRLARRFGEPLRLLPAFAALAERVWLQGGDDPRLDEAAERLGQLGATGGVEWSTGELAAWLRRLGYAIDLRDVAIAEPHRVLLAGRPYQAAAAWGELSAPYDQAIALLDARDDAAAIEALDLLDRIGADAVAAKLRWELRARGVADVPGRRRASTRANPAGLTARQLDVLALLQQGLTNAELAGRLFISPKTADHHVSAILAKLGVGSRREAAEVARRLGLTAEART